MKDSPQKQKLNLSFLTTLKDNQDHWVNIELAKYLFPNCLAQDNL